MDSETPETRSRLRGQIDDRLPAYIATLVGGAVAIFVNAPLTSPDDLVANAGSIAVASVIGAIIAGMIWAHTKGEVEKRSRTFNIVLTVLLLLIVGAAAAIEYGGDVSHAIRYVVPLGAIGTIFVSILTPIIERWKTQNVSLVVAVVLPLAMLALGYFLTVNEFGFTEAPSLSLPPPPA